MMLFNKTISALLLLVILFSNSSFASWQDMLKDADKVLKSSTGKSVSANAGSILSNDQIAQGLKEALDIGVKTAVDSLGKENGFLSDQAVKIMMPEEMKTVEKLLRSVGQEKIIDDYVTSMNRAAEQAVPKVTDIFVNSISQMSLSDARSILSGSNTAATDYFRNNTSEQLRKQITPYIKSAMDKSQVTQYYQSLSSKLKQYDTFGLSKKYLGDIAEVDQYVTDKTLDGLFAKIAEQEKLIRANPMARSTDILKTVFAE